MIWTQMILIVALVIIPTYFGYKKLPKEMTISVLSIALALAFVNIDKISRFKGAGFEAEMRVQKAVERAYAAIEEVKELGLILSSPIIDQIALDGQFMQHLSEDYKAESVKKIADTLRKLGATESEIEATCRNFYDIVSSRYTRIIVANLKEMNPEKKSLFEDGKDREMFNWNLDQIKALISKHNLSKNDIIDKSILASEYFSKHKTLPPERGER